MATTVLTSKGLLVVPSGTRIATNPKDIIYLSDGVYFQFVPLAMIDSSYRMAYRYMVPDKFQKRNIFTSWHIEHFYHVVLDNFLLNFASANIPHINGDSNDLLKEMVDK